jgi:hypothetical protein
MLLTSSRRTSLGRRAPYTGSVPTRALKELAAAVCSLCDLLTATPVLHATDFHSYFPFHRFALLIAPKKRGKYYCRNICYNVGNRRAAFA